MVSVVDLLLDSVKKDTSEISINNAFVEDNGVIDPEVDVHTYESPLNMPVDSWTFIQWKSLITKMYDIVFESPFPYSDRRSFNIIFRDIFDTAREEYELTNEEIASFIRWLPQGYLVYVKRGDHPFNLRNVKFKIGIFYDSHIQPLKEEGDRQGKNLRGIIVDPDYLKESIEENLDDNLDHLIRQLGIPTMTAYCMAYEGMSAKESSRKIYSEIKSRLRFELSYMPDRTSFMEDTIRNSIHWGPYGFHKSLMSLGVPNWRDALSWHIDHYGFKEKDWWLDESPRRKSHKSLNKMFVKRFSKIK